MRYLIFGILVCFLNYCKPPNDAKTDSYEWTIAREELAVKRIVITPFDNNIIRIQAFPDDSTENTESLVVENPNSSIGFFDRQENQDKVVLKTSTLTIELDKKTGLVTFKNNSGNIYLDEQDKNIEINPEYSNFNNLRISFVKDSSEAIYGLGQHEEGIMNYQGHKVKLVQRNTKTSVPFHLTTHGYGILWDNYSVTHYDFTGNNYTIASDLGKGIDYYFVAGENADSIINGYRKLTGDVPLLPKWGYGYWQSRERYKTQDELLDVAETFRKKEFPVDLIIQDWQYWGKHPWNAFLFAPEVFPEPEKMIQKVHSLDMKFMLVIWARFQPGSEVYNKLKEKGYLYPDIDTNVVYQYGKWAQEEPLKGMVLATYYDVYNPGARKLYWEMVKNRFFDIGVDAWWVDAPEPDLVDMSDYETYLGPGAYYHNTYPLMHAKGIYEGQRGVTSKKRVCQLIRSSFAGQQRYGIVAWSGDVVARWDNFKKQIAAAVNFNLSGIPYWTSDIGGFFIWDYDEPNSNPEYIELYTRWFQFGTFCPVFRSHGSNAPREPWLFNEETEIILRQYTHLRYRLIPYIYSNAWQITKNRYTMMRGLIMDFQSDENVYGIDDQFMFGPSLMVCPVTGYKAKTREVYLPASSEWYDFFTNECIEGGKNMIAQAPIDKIPLYVKAGSIIPMGPKMQYVNEKETDTVILRIYPGMNAKFAYYMDEGDNYNYEQEKYAIIHIYWDDNEQKITLSDREGTFPGMKDKLIFNIELIDEETIRQSGTLSYEGEMKSLSLLK
jgi:alpha-D-xyloside xylohydrolase